MNFNCHLCNQSFTLKSNLIKHTQKYHNGVFDCPYCNQEYDRYDNFLLHYKTCNHNKKLAEQQQESLQSRKKKKQPLLNANILFCQQLVRH